jgi:hypothetical protein
LRRFASVRLLLLLAAAGGGAWLVAHGSDHSDAPVSAVGTRQDANLTDLHAFTVGDNLVLALSSNPAIPKSAATYVFPNDVTFEINIDVDSQVSPDDPAGMGGTILEPDRLQEDLVFRVRFRADGKPDVRTFARRGLGKDFRLVNCFAGLRDDPFIRGPRQGRNVASIVLEVPLASITQGQSTLLIWATSKVDEFDGRFQDLAGRSLRSMMPENKPMNLMHPRQQQRQMGLPPDVMIYDVARPAEFPNGRALTDDVVDLVGDERVLANDAAFPDANDLPFLAGFPYLARRIRRNDGSPVAPPGDVRSALRGRRDANRAGGGNSTARAGRHRCSHRVLPRPARRESDLSRVRPARLGLPAQGARKRASSLCRCGAPPLGEIPPLPAQL